MPSVEEMTAWTPEDIEAEIRVALPKDWQFEYGCSETGGWAVIRDAEGEPKWETAMVPDERLLLFDAYGWLITRNAVPRLPAWRRRRGEIPTPRVGHYSLPGVSVPDPEDLDPAEVAAVYDKLHRR